MKHVICIIHDRVADLYNLPMFFRSVGEAIRSFTDEINREDKQNNLYMHSDDYDLYLIGYYNTTDGSVELIERSKCILGREAKSVVPARLQAVN